MRSATRLGVIVLVVLALGHAVSGLAALGAAVSAFAAAGFAGVLGGVLLSFLGSALLAAAVWAAGSGRRLLRGEETARTPAVYALILFAIVGVFTPMGAGVVAVAVPTSTAWVQVGVVGLAVAGIALLRPVRA